MKLLNNDNQEINTIDLGIVKAGDKKEYEYVLQNETSRRVIEIKVEVANEEVEILEAPEQMSANSMATLRLAWKPSLTVKRGLKSLIKVTASELYE